MRIIKELDKKEKEAILEGFYKQFDTGFAFEDFLKPFLESLGLSEVQVTKKTGDGGVDLLGVLKGVIDGEDDTSYRIQAKRYKPTNNVPPKEIDALRGNLLTNQKGIFITTGRVSKNAIKDGLEKDPNRPVIVFDGERLINKLIDLEIGFGFKPVFSTEALKDYIDKNVVQNPIVSSEIVSPTVQSGSIKKTITNNDIRAGIISIPSGIVKLLKDAENKRQVSVVANDKSYFATFVPARKYLGGVTAILKDFGLKCDDGSFKEKEAYWTTDGISFNLIIK